ncbi:hypothetical protein PIB30_045650 [Stylosanthes scabra]|uniref:Ubiquitin-like protease family profile domain-containing protein n=1 Tax=Stylosanthes scabra TaxID=79078 RepID=A0ABU6XGG5_9FABA|nr:hypothetical protein [Stylosanthes scabra]
MTSTISSLAKILESQSSPSTRLFIQESITSTLNTKSTPGNSPNILTSDTDVDIKELYQDNADTKLVKPDEYVLNKLRMPSQARRVLVKAKSTDGKYIGKKASSSFVLPRRSFCQKIPKNFMTLHWMPMAFRVPEDMFLASNEIACAAYIFDTDFIFYCLNSDEILETTDANFISGKYLFTLVPGEQVVQDVLDTLACHLQRNIERYSKYPPCDNLREQFATKCMEKVDFVSRIFVLIYDENNHWFLMVVDMNKDRIYLIDSAKSTSSKHQTIIGGFRLKPCNDCGIWVAEWMKKCGWIEDFDITVIESIRMRLAIDLVRGDSNLKRAEVISKAHVYMKNLLEKQLKLITV